MVDTTYNLACYVNHTQFYVKDGAAKYELYVRLIAFQFCFFTNNFLAWSFLAHIQITQILQPHSHTCTMYMLWQMIVTVPVVFILVSSFFQYGRCTNDLHAECPLTSVTVELFVAIMLTSCCGTNRPTCNSMNSTWKLFRLPSAYLNRLQDSKQEVAPPQHYLTQYWTTTMEWNSAP